MSISTRRWSRYERVEKLLALLTSSGGGGGPIALSGNVIGMSNANTVVAINNATVPAIGAVGTVLQVTGASSLGYGLVNLASSVTGVLPVANQAPQPMGGQITGFTNNATIPLGGQISGTPANASIQRAALGPVRFIDPSNSSGLASDSNNGATSVTPILTTAHLNSLLFFRTLTADTTITYMSDDPGSVGLDFSTMALSTFALTFQGTPQVLHTGGTLNAGTIAINPHAAGGGQRQVVHTSDLATFNPFVHTVFGGAATNPTRLVDNTTTSGAWIVTDTTPAAPSVTQPTNPDGTIGTLTIGDTYHITRGSTLAFADAAGAIVGDSGIVANDFAFKATSVGTTAALVTYNRCSFLNTVSVLGQFNDCALMVGTTSTSICVAGLYVPNAPTGSVNGVLALGGNCYIAQPASSNAFQVGPFRIAQLFVFEQFGVGSGGIQIQDSSGNGLEIYQGGGILCEVLIWGNGNTGFGISIRSSASAAIGESATVPSVTGTLGDFAFVTAGGGADITVARAFNPATGAYTEAGGVATRTTTWAHFAASITPGGGFNFQAHCLESNAHLTGSD